MTGGISLPSIKISRASPSGTLEPITPISDADSPNTEDPGAEGTRSNGSLAIKPSIAHTVDATTPSYHPPNANPNPNAPTMSKKAPQQHQQQPQQHIQGVGDPLTMQIMRRTGTQTSGMLKLSRHDTELDPERTAIGPAGGVRLGNGALSAEKGGKLRDDTGTAGSGGAANGTNGIGGKDATSGGTGATGGHTLSGGKDKKKGVSFLSRIMGGKKKDNEVVDEDDPRTTGMDAHVFSQPIGYTPTFPTPPKYIRVHTHHKPQRDFNQTFLAQELYSRPSNDPSSKSAAAADPSETPVPLPEHKSGAIWAMRFSKDGRYLAAAGEDKIVRIWQVLSSKQDRETHEREEEAGGESGSYPAGNGVRLNAPLFRSEPIREYHGHTGDVLDLSWSKNNFLLSSSMDKTVRLWHVSRKECLCSFQHADFVTSIAFHPRDDRFFLAGSLDSKLRLWSIPDKVVAYWVEVHDLITAVAFTPDGRTAIAGCLNGNCAFYETEGLKFHTNLLVRSSRGKNAGGSKITGIDTCTLPPDDPSGDTKILVSSNDSRIRLYHARDKTMEIKFKGYENTCSQIHATFSDDGKYVISGSEDRRVYIWNLQRPDGDRKDKRPVEFFEATHIGMITAALLAPTPTRELLSLSGDPLYDLCNPPPVTLVDRSDSIAPSSRPPSPAPSSTTQANPAWLDRAKHFHGNIIITADYTGRIKVFRQDCAAAKRKLDSFDANATLSKRILRNGSLRSRHSRNAHSPDRSGWRQSITSIRSVETAGSGLRGWRHGQNTLPTPTSSIGFEEQQRQHAGSGAHNNGSSRSASPGHPPPSTASSQPAPPPSTPVTPSSSGFSRPRRRDTLRRKYRRRHHDSDSDSGHHSDSEGDDDTSKNDSYSTAPSSSTLPTQETPTRNKSRRSRPRRAYRPISKTHDNDGPLSSGAESDNEKADTANHSTDTAVGGSTDGDNDDEETVSCRKCGGMKFKAVRNRQSQQQQQQQGLLRSNTGRRIGNNGMGGGVKGQRLVCVKCGASM